MKTNNPSNRDQSPDDKPSDRRQSAGWQYVRAFLPHLNASGFDAEAEWIVDALDRGDVRACPRCCFLFLPCRPFALDTAQQARIDRGEEPAPVDACDVCGSLLAAARLDLLPEDMSAALDEAAWELQTERRVRAATLFALANGAMNGAEALLLSHIADAVDAVRQLGRGNR